MGDALLCDNQKHPFQNRQGKETANSTLYMKPVRNTLRNKCNYIALGLTDTQRTVLVGVQLTCAV
jgi:hypothetical protein